MVWYHPHRYPLPWICYLSNWNDGGSCGLGNHLSNLEVSRILYKKLSRNKKFRTNWPLIIKSKKVWSSINSLLHSPLCIYSHHFWWQRRYELDCPYYRSNIVLHPLALYGCHCLENIQRIILHKAFYFSLELPDQEVYQRDRRDLFIDPNTDDV